MIVRERPRAVLLGRMATMPFGGVVWQTVHYLLGLERLGFETYYVEAHAVAPRHFIRHVGDDGAAAAAAFIDGVLSRFGLVGRWAFHALDSDGSCYGMSEARLYELYGSAEVLLNLHGGTRPRPEHAASRRLVCIATDPVQLEVELNQRVAATLRFCAAHSAIFSFGENYGRPDCLLPVSKAVPIRPTRQPVVLELWAGRRGRESDRFTTVSNWSQKRPLRFAGESYEWSKDLEFLKVLDLPARTPQPLELALSRCSDEHRELLAEHGWHVRDALEISADLDSYRDYITASRGEFTVAKDQNVRLRSGWFSDRSATYLAAGRPVVTQDTGFGNVLPTGEGLFAFRDAGEAAAAIDEINADYPRHRRAAQEIAREHFAHDVVLGSLLEEAGVELPHRAPRAPAVDGALSGLRVMLAAHRFPPDATGGVERYTEMVAEALAAAGHAVSVVARRPGAGPLRREVERLPSGVLVHRLVGGAIRRERFLQEREGREQLFRDALAETDPDVVHVNHVVDLSPGLLGIARERGAAVVLTLHDYYFACHRIILRTLADEPCGGPEGGRACAERCSAAGDRDAAQRWSLRTMYFRRLLGLADRIVCPSPFVSDFFGRFGAPPDRLRVVANGIRLERYALAGATAETWSTPRERGRLVLAFLGTMQVHKGLDVVLHALREAGLDAAELTAFGPVGDGARAAELYALADAVPGLRFRMYGEYQPEDLPLLLQDIDCVVVPSQWPETFCLVAHEALALGIPVAVARMGALPDRVTEEVNGFVFDHDRPDRLAAVLRRLAEEEDLVARLRRGARETRVPTLADHASALQAVYREALDEAGRTRRAASADLYEIAALERSLETLGFGAGAPETPREPTRPPRPRSPDRVATGSPGGSPDEIPAEAAW